MGKIKMIIKNIKQFKPRKKYVIYGVFMNHIMTYKQMQEIMTEEEIQMLIKNEKIVEF
jgi:hypothetical protein